MKRYQSAYSRTVFQSIFRLFVLGAAIAAPRVAEAFCIQNQVGVAADAEVLEGDFSKDIAAGSSACCSPGDTGCNPGGNPGAVLSAQIEAGDFSCVVSMPANGVAALRQEDRSQYGLPPSYYCVSYDVLGQQFDISNDGVGATTRDIRFLATADPQYDNADILEKIVSDVTLNTALDMIRNDRRIRGLLIAGDLTQNSRPYDELAWYKTAISGMSRFVFDGMGNHDLMKASYWQAEACFWGADECISPQMIQSEISTRARATSLTNKGVPHYSWDWHDVHFVQLNLFPGDYRAPGQKEHAHMFALSFLVSDLAMYVGRSARPVVIMHHYGFDPFSTGLDEGEYWWTEEQRKAYWDALAPYNVAAILTGHSHKGPEGEFYYPFHRPQGKTNGPDSIPAFIVGAAEAGAFTDIEMSPTRMTVVRRDFLGDAVPGKSMVLDLVGNLAAGRPATQSSTAWGGAAERAVDGNRNGNYWYDSVTHTSEEASPWWQVDLGAVQGVGDVVLYNRTDECCSDRLADFELLVSVDGETWESFPHDGVAPAVTRIRVDRDARYVQVRLDPAETERPLSLAEVEVLPNRGNLTVKHSSLRVGVAGGSLQNGAGVSQQLHTGTDSQRISMEDVGGGRVRLVFKHSGKCLVIPNGSMANEVQAVQSDCTGAQHEQFLPVDTGDGHFKLVARHSEKCLSVSYAGMQSGAALIQWPCGTGDFQRFRLRPEP